MSFLAATIGRALAINLTVLMLGWLLWGCLRALGRAERTRALKLVGIAVHAAAVMGLVELLLSAFFIQHYLLPGLLILATSWEVSWSSASAR